MHQLELDLSTQSPINKDKLKGQNLKIFEALSEGKTLDLFKAWQELNVMSFHSRIADIRKAGVIIHDRFVTKNGNTFKEYSLKPFE